MKILITKKQFNLINEVEGEETYEEKLAQYKKDLANYNAYMNKRNQIINVLATISKESSKDYDRYEKVAGYNSNFFKIEGDKGYDPQTMKTHQTVVNAVNQFKSILGSYKPTEQINYYFRWYDTKTGKSYCKWSFNIPYLPKIKKPIPPAKPVVQPPTPVSVPPQVKKPEPKVADSIFVDNSLLGFRLENNMFKPIKPEEFGKYAVRADRAKNLLQPGNESQLNAYVSRKIPNYQGLYK